MNERSVRTKDIPEIQGTAPDLDVAPISSPHDIIQATDRTSPETTFHRITARIFTPKYPERGGLSQIETHQPQLDPRRLAHASIPFIYIQYMHVPRLHTNLAESHLILHLTPHRCHSAPHIPDSSKHVSFIPVQSSAHPYPYPYASA
ncbi:hypothetical protein HDV57DRAFT_107028 [Trichoderma longibrachiatum]|uniref:Uncharacterized protein n=1 Tax=Trichoderma longibrachiatum ATCC 18648 TaxID=983965 RepID=A0A2T4C914_TRILO|nr:hypothetical protein M440DRAFT_1183786 [Trichoderma longibrachiatum ATCC 18648]